MTTRYDAETDALYLRFAETPVSESEEVRPGIVFDFDAEGGSSQSKSWTHPSIWQAARICGR